MARREPLIDSDKAAEYLGYDNRKLLLNNYIRLGIPHYRRGRNVMFRISELDEWLESHREYA